MQNNFREQVWEFLGCYTHPNFIKVANKNSTELHEKIESEFSLEAFIALVTIFLIVLVLVKLVRVSINAVSEIEESLLEQEFV